MKTIKQSNFISLINQRTTYVHVLLCLITLSVIILGFLIPTAHAEEPFRFNRLWPKLTQPWYFSSPNDVAIAPDGLVYVSDTGFHRIQVFSAEGEYIRSWGIKGSGEGEFESPVGIAVSASSKVYVMDGENHRIQIFNTSGVFEDEWGSEGSGRGKFKFTFDNGIAISASGDVYVVDAGNSRIQVFTAEGKFIRSWGTKGSGEGEFDFTRKSNFSRSNNGMAVSADNEVYVVEAGNNRIQVFGTNGEFKRKWDEFSFGVGIGLPGLPPFPIDIAISARGEVYVTVGEHDDVFSPYVIQVFNAEGEFQRGLGFTGDSFGLGGIAVSHTGLVYVGDAANDQIHVFDSKGIVKNLWGSGVSNGQFTYPSEIAVNTSLGEVYVLDNDAASEISTTLDIHVFDVNGNFRRSWSLDEIVGPNEFGLDLVEFFQPGGLATSTNGLVYIRNRVNAQIYIFDINGVLLGNWEHSGSSTDIAVSSNGLVYVTDRHNHRIQVFEDFGKFRGSWGSEGSGEGEFSFPDEIAVSASGDVYVTDTGNNRIQVFTAEGKFIRSWGTKGSGDREFEFGFDHGIAISASGLVSVVDGSSHRIQVFDENGEFIESISSLGSSPGQVNFPSDVAFDSKGALLVADTGNRRIQKFVRGERPFNKKLRKAIILAGGGPSKGSYTNLIWDETEKLSKKAFFALTHQGFQKGEIKFLTAGNTQDDLDDNKKFDDLERATLESLRKAITEWAVDADNVVIYLIDHGGPGVFDINNSEKLEESLLTQWVEELNEKIPDKGKVTLIIEACKSASFLKPLANKNKRINLISSTNADQPNTVSNGGLNSFSFFFWSAINFGKDLQKAYRDGRDGIKRPRRNGEKEDPQDPHLDSNGDQQFNKGDDFTTLADFCLGNCTDYSPTPPTIVNPSAPTELNGPTVATLSMQVESKEPILRAWVVIKDPDFKHPNNNEPISDLPEFDLECDDNKRCMTSHGKFDVNGDYVITYNVLDTKLQQAPPKTKILTQRQGIPTNECTLDADGDGNFDALTDGLLLIRHMFGIRGDSLIKGAVASACTTCSVAEVETILEQCGSAGTSDIDGNGQVDALTDGLLMIRYLFGIRGDSLINGSVANNCSRCTATEIEAYMQGLMP